MTPWTNHFTGCLLGIAVGDSIGLPREGLSARRAQRMFGAPPLRHRLVLGRGMISDDTEHACMTAQALLAAGHDPDRFARSLAWRLRGWLLGAPAGIGLATLRSILKLWVGFPPSRSGVYSAGNGPAMRAPILGVWCAATGADDDLCRRYVRASTRLTHTDPKAYEGALAVAMLVRFQVQNGSASPGPGAGVKHVLGHVQGDELRHHLELIGDYLDRAAPLADYAAALGLHRGVSGYINHTVPVAIFAALRWPNDSRRAIEEALSLGGDTDTVGAIIGGILGASGGPSALPHEWIDGIADWPRSVSWMRRLGDTLGHAVADPNHHHTVPLFWPGLVLRNTAFILIVLAHGFRRLFPPY